METKGASPFWWVKTASKEENGNNLVVPRLELDISSSLADFLEKEQNELYSNREDRSDVDVGSIIEEINRVAAQSPLGPYRLSIKERSIEEILREAEQIYLESSKSFEQLSQRSGGNPSQRSKTSQNLTDLNSSHSKESTPTPKSISPLPNDDSDSETYSDDFSEESKIESLPSPIVPQVYGETSSKMNVSNESQEPFQEPEEIKKEPKSLKVLEESNSYTSKALLEALNTIQKPSALEALEVKQRLRNSEMVVPHLRIPKVLEALQHPDKIEEQIAWKEIEEKVVVNDEQIKVLLEDNRHMREDIRLVRADLVQTTALLDQTKAALSAKTRCSPEINLDLEKTLEELMDSKEINTALQLQLDTLNNTHCLLKTSYEELMTSNKSLERRVLELDATLSRYKNELVSIQTQKDTLQEVEVNLSRAVEIERLQINSLKLQNEKDAKCIQDLSRQIKEMERIIARKHPDSVSALIVAAKQDATECNLTARKILEDRIQTLEEEASNRDLQSSRVFMDTQDKFNQMKLKYESHIENLELHANDLKDQLKRKADTFGVYTQTSFDEKYLQKDIETVCTQTDIVTLNYKAQLLAKRTEKVAEIKEDSHLIATIRGLQVDLTNKEKVVLKLQREVDELKKTNRKLQKEREGSLRSLSDKKGDFRSYPERLAFQTGKAPADEEEAKFRRAERDKIKQQLCRMEADYQSLKTKRLHDLNTLQEAHEREISTYVSNVTPLREQLELQQVSLSTLQSQLSKIKEELLIVTVERDHLNNQLSQLGDERLTLGLLSYSRCEIDSLQKK